MSLTSILAILLVNYLLGELAVYMVKTSPNLQQGIPKNDFMVYRFAGVLFFPLAFQMSMKLDKPRQY